ncbi:D-xylose transport system ATP-binding protein [Clostridium tetanomorphum]|uniref:Xylose ABC transporter ATP-binding protein n=1 Tax=Clostridium tetanomorphum TaxID=1553 RepID=A0A923ECW9_CLOTT|nr:xylose ABC transporter ATP-binding protein [Clostridium tetanomorphum]KAJ52924.1 ABC transporter-like protein [Clostridium tetanomorphum DSM 665]MBC2398178.1 xylose ABC transporter ATP-binding protein [Clostridium tetanomorphum]MBP1864864.1 D-xylose transport system ATP-binding protein [Clostridium tetanomorphum]NRS83070.1 D-xylose transport system ATP-binding protein [Clostridium tetanomorphum]NRZ98833.1 D-xylose transport system ATP-binding protein [Clostridium tetanomorphum]
MSKYILEMNNITKEFSGVKALDNVCLKVEKGEIHALCGENGAGKSTLMKVLSGIYKTGTHGGEIIYEGKKINLNGIKDSENLGIIIIHQELALIKELSISENIFIGSEISNHGIINFNEMYNKTKKLLDEVKLDINPATKVKELGIGQQQLVEIAKALAKNAKLLILDEPTASLTDSEVKVLMGIMKGLKAKGVTCIYISHKLNEVMLLADNVTVIRDGRAIGTEKIENLTEEKIIKMMVGREMKDLYPREEHEIGEEFFEVRNFTAYDSSNKKIKKVKDLNFKLRKGEILGIAGLIGSGRTELVSCIYGSYPGKYEGEAYLEGKKLNIKGPSDALKYGVAMVPEDRKRHGIIADMSVRNNITIANILKYKGSFNCIDKDQEILDVKKYIEEIKVKTSSMNLNVGSLSGGNQQKVVLAKNLLVQPRILILDEPTRGIDVGAKYEIYKLMFELVKKGISIIMVSSELPEVLGISDRVLVMHEGELKGDFINKDLTQEKIMECAIGGSNNGK